MKKPRKFMSLAIILCVIVTLVGFGIISSAFASSQPLVIQNAKLESVTVGSVTAVSTGSKLKIDINTDKEFPLFLTVLTFRGNTGGVTHADSTARTEFLTHKSDTHHEFSIPLSEIKEDDVEISVSADVIVNGKVTGTKKAFVTARIKVPEVTTTTEKKAEVTTTTERRVEVVTTVAAVTSTTAPAVVTTETVAPITTSTTVLPVTTTTLLPVATTVAPRAVLPITGTDYNWYLIGAVLVLLGAAIYLGSAQRSN